MRSVTAWHKSLKPGDLAIAWNAADKRRHIIKLIRCGAEYDSRHHRSRGREPRAPRCRAGDVPPRVATTRATPSIMGDP